MGRYHTRWSERPLVWFLPSLLMAFGIGLSGCGDEQGPSISEMSLRELLGLAPERVAELSDADRRVFAERLGTAWAEQIAEPERVAHVSLPDELAEVDKPLQSPLAFVQAHDMTRARRGLEVQVLGEIDADQVEARLTQLRLPPEAIGFRFDRGLHLIEVPEDTAAFHGELVYDETWGRVEEEALDGMSQRETIEALDDVWRRVIAQTALPDVSSVRIAPANRAPVAVWFAHDHRALLINPSLLYLLDTGALDDVSRTQVTDLRTTTHALELAFIEQCVVEQQLRCDACFGPGGDPTGPACLPLFSTSADPAAECTSLVSSQPDGFRLYCHNRFIQQNLGCFLAKGYGNICGAAGAPYETVEDLSNLSPMLTDERCQQALDDCQTSRLTPIPVSDDDPPPVDGSSRGGSNSAWSSACLSECLAIGCDIGVSVLTQMACEACAESAGDSGGGGGGGCGSACEGDGMAARHDGPTAAAGVVFALPFFFLFGVWWSGRREDESSCVDALTDAGETDDSGA